MAGKFKSYSGIYEALDLAPLSREQEAEIVREHTEGHRIVKFQKKSFVRYGISNGMFGKKHSDYSKSLMSEWRRKNPAGIAHLDAIRNSTSRTYTIVDPHGVLLTIKNLTQFAKENNLNVNSMRNLIYGAQKQHKGYRRP